MYSYKEPRKKPLFDKGTKLWFSFASLAISGLVGYSFYLYGKASSFNGDIESITSSNKVLVSSVGELEKELKILKMQQMLSSEVSNSNRLLNNSVKNLFDLVPDQIMLSKVIMKKDTLTLEGLSSTKDAYRLLLEPPLKSIFNESKVNFEFQSSMGRYKFVSINSASSKVKEKTDVKK
jgi:predicted nucleic acid-binding protein